MPVLWRSPCEIVAYSRVGCQSKIWEFPPDWNDITTVDAYDITPEGLKSKEKGRSVADHKIALSLAPGQAVAILSAGADPDNRSPIPASSRVQFVGEDRATKGSWIGIYGPDGYEIVGGEVATPPYAERSYIGGRVSTWAASTTDSRALQSKGNLSERLIAERSSPIHEVVDVTVSGDAPRDVALYFVDWERKNRQMIVDAVCANTNHALDTRVIRDFKEGVYLHYRMTGRIQFRFTILGRDGNIFDTGEVTYSGLFFGRTQEALDAGGKREYTDSWVQVARILAGIRPPTFFDKDFNIENYGAIPDGKTDCTQAFRDAIATCDKSGGGRVIVPAGEFLTGPVHLKSKVNLYAAKGAVVRFIPDPQKYLPVVYTRYEGNECFNYSPFIYAFEQENIAITGEGTFDGQGTNDIWQKQVRQTGKDDSTALRRMAEEGVAVEHRRFGEGHGLRPNMVQLYKCRNVLIEGVTFKDSDVDASSRPLY